MLAHMQTQVPVFTEVHVHAHGCTNSVCVRTNAHRRVNANTCKNMNACMCKYMHRIVQCKHSCKCAHMNSDASKYMHVTAQVCKYMHQT